MSRYAYILLLIVFEDLFSQKDTIWFDSDWVSIEKDSAKYYRITNLKEKNFKTFYLFADYDTSDLKIKEGITLDKDKNNFEGEVIYYKDGVRISERVIYKNGIRYGSCDIYYPSGILKESKNYVLGVLNGKYKSYYETGKISRIGGYLNGEKTGVWREYHKGGRLKKQGSYKSDLKIGIWKAFYYTGLIPSNLEDNQE